MHIFASLGSAPLPRPAPRHLLPCCATQVDDIYDAQHLVFSNK